jgi:ammonium transporter Rh
MEVMLNATLAGGVIMGAAADLITRPHLAMIGGFCIGGVSAFGFCWLGPFLKEKIGLHDSCGVHNLHGIPGFLGGITSALCFHRTSASDWGGEY